MLGVGFSIEFFFELIYVCGGKDYVFSFMVESELYVVKMKQVWNFLFYLLVINVGISVKGLWDDLVEGYNEFFVLILIVDK